MRTESIPSDASPAVQVWSDGHVAFVEFRRPPNNFFDGPMLSMIADELDALGDDGHTRAVVLCSQGKHFCAGADLTGGSPVVDARDAAEMLYRNALRIFAQPLPMVAAVQGSAVGGGLGLALTADYRVADPSAKFVANFSRIGFHQGFGLSVTLPRVVGPQSAAHLLISGRSVQADEARQMGLCDRIADPGGERSMAADVAAQLAEAGPLAVKSIRATMRRGLLAELRPAIEQELEQQFLLMETSDWREGLRAYRDRRTPQFLGR